MATVFRDAPEAFLRMIVVHELAHLKREGAQQGFLSAVLPYGAAIPQLEFDTRLWLTHLSLKRSA